jgi:uncharacterized protein YraI
MYVIGAAIAALALVGVLAWTRLAPAQSAVPAPPVATEEMTVNTEVDLRSGPGQNYYSTGKLKVGDRVKVVTSADKKSTGWLAIEPPTGSFSWISSAAVQQTQQNAGLVIVEETTVKPCGVPYDTVPASELALCKLRKGTQVVILGPVKAGPGGSWYPIEPPPGEYRYVPEAAVVKTGGIQPVGGVSPQAGTGSFVPPPGGETGLMAQAAKARQDAELLYQRVYQSSQDPNEKAEALRQLQILRQAATGPVGQPGFPYNTASVQGGTAPKVTMGTPTSNQPGGNTALYQTAAQPTGAAAWTKWGTLRRATFVQPNGQPMYRLEDERGAPLAYAVAAPGYTLEPYVGRYVTLYGASAYRSDDAMRGNYVVVSQLSTADQR